MNIQTERLVIAPCTEMVLEKIPNNEIGPHIHHYLKELKQDSTLLGWGVWIVLSKNKGEFVGDIGFKGKPNKNQTVEVGYGICPHAQNKGYATEAVNALLGWAFNSHVNKVTAECLKDNLASIKVLEKVGMKKISEDEEMLFWEISNSN